MKRGLKTIWITLCFLLVLSGLFGALAASPATARSGPDGLHIQSKGNSPARRDRCVLLFRLPFDGFACEKKEKG